MNTSFSLLKIIHWKLPGLSFLILFFSINGLLAQSASTYKVIIDNCHSGIENEGTNNTIIVEFLNGNKVVKKSTKKRITECASDASFAISSRERITGINVRTSGNDGFYIDKIELYKDGKRVKTHGKNNGKGWCLSTDPGDANRSWKGKTVNGCKTVQFFKYPATSTSSGSGTEYKVVIDNCHSSITNEGTSNTITAEFMNGNDVVSRKTKKHIKDCANDLVFSIRSQEKITGVRLKTSGNDGFYIDKLELYKGGKRVKTHGKNNGKGWCLSTDPQDATRSWNGKTVNGCNTSHLFKFSSGGSEGSGTGGTGTGTGTGTQYKVVIDNCHSSISNEGTNNTITVAFMNGNRLVGKKSKKQLKDCASDAIFSINSEARITSVKIATSGDNGFYIDKLELYKDGNRVKTHGKNNGKGWCLSTDPSDATRSWKGKTVNGCRSEHSFDFPSSGSAQGSGSDSGTGGGIEYKAVIDNCHSSIENEGTSNVITVAFMNGENIINKSSKKGLKACSDKAIFSIRTNQKITAVLISTSGDNGFYIDKLELYKGGKRMKTHGKNNGKGWCLSTDPNDANKSWKDKTVSGCKSSIKFKY